MSYLEELFGLSGQTAVVIGGAGVLGGAFFSGLARAGAHVIVADLTEEGCNARVQALKSLGGSRELLYGGRHYPRVDRELADGIPKAQRPGEYPRQCRGGQRGHAFLDATDDDWDRVLTVNLKAVFQACQVFGRHMVDSAAAPSSTLAASPRTCRSAGIRLFGLQGRRVEPDAEHRPGIRRQRRAGQRDLSGVLSRRAEPQAAQSTTDRQHHAPHADGPLRRTRGTHRGLAPAGFAKRLRAYSLKQLDALRGYLKAAGVNTVKGGDEDHGAFLATRLAKAMEFPARLESEGIICDARGQWLVSVPIA